MPSLFVSHGAPFTLDDSQWLADLFGWAHTTPKPRAIVAVSAPRERAPAAISGAAAGTALEDDFAGFHPRHTTLTYATPDATGLARWLRGAFADAAAWFTSDTYNGAIAADEENLLDRTKTLFLYANETVVVG